MFTLPAIEADQRKAENAGLSRVSPSRKDGTGVKNLRESLAYDAHYHYDGWTPALQTIKREVCGKISWRR
jgi:hypothetical protein